MISRMLENHRNRNNISRLFLLTVGGSVVGGRLGGGLMISRMLESHRNRNNKSRLCLLTVGGSVVGGRLGGG